MKRIHTYIKTYKIKYVIEWTGNVGEREREMAKKDIAAFFPLLGTLTFIRTLFQFENIYTN